MNPAFSSLLAALARALALPGIAPRDGASPSVQHEHEGPPVARSCRRPLVY